MKKKRSEPETTELEARWHAEVEPLLDALRDKCNELGLDLACACETGYVGQNEAGREVRSVCSVVHFEGGGKPMPTIIRGYIEMLQDGYIPVPRELIVGLMQIARDKGDRNIEAFLSRLLDDFHGTPVSETDYPD